MESPSPTLPIHHPLHPILHPPPIPHRGSVKTFDLIHYQGLLF